MNRKNPFCLYVSPLIIFKNFTRWHSFLSCNFLNQKLRQKLVINYAINFLFSRYSMHNIRKNTRPDLNIPPHIFHQLNEAKANTFTCADTLAEYAEQLQQLKGGLAGKN